MHSSNVGEDGGRTGRKRQPTDRLGGADRASTEYVITGFGLSGSESPWDLGHGEVGHLISRSVRTFRPVVSR